MIISDEELISALEMDIALKEGAKVVLDDLSACIPQLTALSNVKDLPPYVVAALKFTLEQIHHHLTNKEALTIPQLVNKDNN